jgi:hypothetical protein
MAARPLESVERFKEVPLDPTPELEIPPEPDVTIKPKGQDGTG